MIVEKTIVCRILDLTVRKMGLLVKEYSNAQGYIRGETDDLYSATKQAMDKYVKKVQNEEYPLSLLSEKTPSQSWMGWVMNPTHFFNFKAER